MPQTPEVEMYTLEECILSTFYTSIILFIKELFIGKLVWNYVRFELGQAFRNVPSIQCDHSEPPSSWLGDPRLLPCQGSVSGTGSPCLLACHQSLSKGSPPSQPRKGKAEKTSSQDLSGGQHANPHLTPEKLPRSESRRWTRGPALGISPTRTVPRVRVEGGIGGQAPSVSPPCRVKAAMSSHEKPFGRSPSSPYNEQMPHRFGASFANDFKVYLSTPRRLLEPPTAF